MLHFILLFVSFCSYTFEVHGNTFQSVHILSNQSRTKLLRNVDKIRLEILCYEGEPISLVNILKSIEIVVNVPNDNFQYYIGGNVSAVKLQYKDSSWFNFALWKSGRFNVNVHQKTCIGIETKDSFNATLKVIHLDLWRVVALSIGLVVFLLAPLLSKNVLFHYATGVSVGVFGSLLVVVILLSRMFPKKSTAFTIIVGGWSLVLYTLQYLWKNCIVLVQEYQSIVVGYIVTAGLISFIVVYRFGPVSDIRSLKLVKWTLQLSGLGFVFFSSCCKEFTLGVCIILIVQHNIPSVWKTRFRTYWLRYFPPNKLLLTEEEYLEQTRIETQKALENLREFCHSPDCNAWKTMSRLNTPQRFAEFVEGQSHLLDNEILSYESAEFSSTEFTDNLLTSDEDSSSD